MISIKSIEEIEIMRQGGRILASVLRRVSETVKPGTVAADLDKLARELIFSSGGKPSFLNYKPGGSGEGYPAALCVSLNDEIVHGLPTEKKILREGDIVKLDLGVEYKKLFTDATVMVGVGKISPVAEKIMRVTKECLDVGIKKIRPGASLNEYGLAVEEHAFRNEFEIVRDLVGHGVGHKVHEAPQVYNYADRRMNEVILQEGMTLALEPMVNEGTFEIVLAKDSWTYLTRDGKLNGHWEHTVAVTKYGCEILTVL
ncbi:MAG TPA: type I methionyl aminopeptidase [Candidatus Bathyarchaeia archaeon]|nr:type I methionyl aminopeptidase [Candidatus Bathyarchaeia archaeon]